MSKVREKPTLKSLDSVFILVAGGFLERASSWKMRVQLSKVREKNGCCYTRKDADPGPLPQQRCPGAAGDTHHRRWRFPGVHYQRSQLFQQDRAIRKLHGYCAFFLFFRCWLLVMPLAKCFLLQLLSIRARASTQLFRRTVSVALSRVSVFTLFCRLETLSQALTLLCPLCPHLAPQMEDNVCP